jgi:hypothetical protein
MTNTHRQIAALGEQLRALTAGRLEELARQRRNVRLSDCPRSLRRSELNMVAEEENAVVKEAVAVARGILRAVGRSA